MKNNEAIRIAIAETSVIIRGGLTAALKRLPNVKVQPIELLSVEALSDCLRTQYPEMLIVNPTFGDYFDVNKFREETAGKKIRLIALVSSFVDASLLTKYDESISIFDDLDTILLMIPLQIMMIGPRWQLLVIILIVFLLLSFGWKKLSKYNMRQDWKAILFYSVLVFAATQSLYLITKNLYGEDASIHIEVLLPAFVLGMVMKHKDIDTAWERKASTGISFIFMFLVGMSMPPLQGISLPGDIGLASITGSQEMMPWALIIVHVVIVSLLSNVGKLFPVFFYRDRKLSERLALSIGMFTRGEVGAGVIFIALGYNLGGPALVISVLTIVLNLILTGIFVLWVKKLALMSYQE